jgi:hypothetical protein
MSIRGGLLEAYLLGVRKSGAESASRQVSVLSVWRSLGIMHQNFEASD